ncbi:cohesin complex subunit [Coemansia sp. RSA 552]|nr:cohesin complex subunit [Coemansia sp. RSA 552]
MTTTPRRSTRVSKAPERLAATGPATPSRGKKKAGASAFSSPRSARSKRQRTSKKAESSDEAESGSDREAGAESSEEEEAVSDSEEEAATSSEEEEEEARPVRKKAPLKKTPAPKRQQRQQTKKSKSTAATQAAQNSTTTERSQLLEAVVGEDAAVAQAIKDWIASYRSEPDAALCALINFVIGLGGCAGGITEDAVQATDAIEETVEALQEQAIAALRGRRDADVAGALVLGRTREQRRARRSALQFVRGIVEEGQHHVIFAGAAGEHSRFTEALVQWLAGLGASALRALRHAAALVGLAVQTSLASVRARARSEKQTAQRQLDAEVRRGARAARASSLRSRVDALEQQDEMAGAAFDALYGAVFIFRYRDVHATVRTESLAPLATWCRLCPEAYLDTEHLRFLGWALNDADARVREAALHAIAGPLLQGRLLASALGPVGAGVCALSAGDACDTGAVVEGVRPFVTRFLPRIVQVAAGDVDARVQAAALQLVVQIARQGLMDGMARIGDIRRLQPQQQQRPDKRREQPKRNTYSGTLSQQLLDESSDESEEDDTVDGLAIQVLDPVPDSDGVLECPRHAAMRFLAPLIVHTHAPVRAAAAELVAWWVRLDWTAAASDQALGADADQLDGSSDEDSSDEGGDEAESVNDLLAASGAHKARARKWLLYRAVAAFLWHISRPENTESDTTTVTDAQEQWVAGQAAARVEELWAAPALAMGAADEATAVPGVSEPATALDNAIAAAVGADHATPASARLVAAAQALWPRLEELSDAAALASYLAWDHSEQDPSHTSVRARFALAPGEETVLLQAFAVCAAEKTRSTRRRDREQAEATQQALARMWHSAFVPLLARHADSVARLLPLASLAACHMDLQALFDASHSNVVADTAHHMQAALRRYGENVRLARLAMAFLDRVDASRTLRGDGDDALVRSTATTAAEAMVAPQAEPFAGAYAHVVVLRAAMHSQDVTAAMAGEPLAQLHALIELASRADAVAVPERTAMAALDTAHRALLWQALSVDQLLQRADSDSDASTEVAVRQLRADSDRLMVLCTALLAGEGAHGRLRELAFVVLGRTLQLFLRGGGMARGGELRQVLATDGGDARARLADFFAARIQAWAQLAPRLPGNDDDDDDSDDIVDGAPLKWWCDAPSAWGTEYARVCAMAALWARWLGRAAGDTLGPLAAHTGLIGLEPIERRRAESTSGAPAQPHTRKVGFVALSAYDHIVQAGVDALKPMLLLHASRPRATAAFVAALRASYDRYLAGAGDAVNIATLARFITTALRTAAQPSSASRASSALAPPPIGAAWTESHQLMIDSGLALGEGNGSDGDSDPWDTRVAPWFAALAHTVTGVIRPRHAETLDAHLRRALDALPADRRLAEAAVAPYQRALDKELDKLGAIKARMAEATSALAQSAADLLPSSPVRPSLAAAAAEPMDIDE